MYIDHNPTYSGRPQVVSECSTDWYGEHGPSYAVISDSAATRGPSHVRAPGSHMTSAALASQHYEVQQPASRYVISEHYEVQEQQVPVAQDYKVLVNADTEYSRLQHK